MPAGDVAAFGGLPRLPGGIARHDGLSLAVEATRSARRARRQGRCAYEAHRVAVLGLLPGLKVSVTEARLEGVAAAPNGAHGARRSQRLRNVPVRGIVAAGARNRDGAG